MKEPIPKRDRTIVRHLRTIQASGDSLEAYAEALQGVRDDPRLSRAKQDAIWRTLAQEAAQAYYVFTTGQPLDLDAIMEQFEKTESA